MFNKLKIRLILINISTLSVILFIIFSGIYLTMSNLGEHATQMVISSIVKEDKLTTLDYNNNDPNFNIFYIKTNQLAGLLEISSNATISKEDAVSIVDLVSKHETASGVIKYNKLSLKYLKVQKQYGFIIVILDKSQPDSILNRLLFSFLIIGIISIFLVFIVSLFLANKALVPIKTVWDNQKNFIADASHELNTPLTVINTNLEIVMDNKDDLVESQSKWLENAQWEINRMSKLLQDLLLIASSDSEELNSFKAPFNISYTLEQTIFPFEPLAEIKGIIIKTEIEPEIDFCGDEGRIKQLITILTDNAIKYTNEGGNVTVKLNSDESTIEILVIDSGEGIPKEHLGRIFERFYRVEKSRSRNFGGSGLGLSIAECIVKEHNGSISVTSSLGEGSIFKVSFPIKG